MHPRFQYAAILLLVLLLPLSLVGVERLGEQPLHHIPTLVGLASLALLIRRRRLSDAAVLCTLAFCALHVLGARYLYSNVPYDRWLDDAFGFTLAETFGFRRNHYDRLVHFAYGALITFPQIELLRHRLLPNLRNAALASVVLVLAVSALYELVEWSVALVLAPERAERYNGQQGDVWDAHKDMALALLGATLATLARLSVARGADHDETTAE